MGSQRHQRFHVAEHEDGDGNTEFHLAEHEDDDGDASVGAWQRYVLFFLDMNCFIVSGGAWHAY